MTSCLGWCFFADGGFLIWDKGTYEKGDFPHWEPFKRGTIVINNLLLEKKKYRKKEIFVCLRELCHWAKDQNYFNGHSENIVQICDSKSIGKTDWYDAMSDRDLIERQTNYMCAATLMPKSVVKNSFFKLMRFKTIPNEPIEYKAYMKKHIATLANSFGINFNPVLYRLFDLKILQRPGKEGVM